MQKNLGIQKLPKDDHFFTLTHPSLVHREASSQSKWAAEMMHFFFWAPNKACTLFSQDRGNHKGISFSL